MNKEEINALARSLAEAGRVYHTTGKSIMSDQEYDAKLALLKSADKDHPLFEKVGETPSSLWKKASHTIAMGSLEKVNTVEEFQDWARKFPGEVFVLEPKLDGLSLSIDYENGKFVRAVTRGDGSIGEEISANVQKMSGYIEILALPYTGSVRCEIVLPVEALDRINSTLAEDDKYSNCRNAAAGISRGLDGRYCQYLNLMYYDIIMDKDEVFKITRIRNSNLKSVMYSMGDADKMVSAFDQLRQAREKLPYKIDGAVVKVNSYQVQQEAGVLNGRPKGQIAWKFDPPGAATYLREVIPEVGRTGVVTPVGLVDPVEIDGSIVSRVTLHNYAEIARLGVGIGDMVMLIKAGDIIPKITEVLELEPQKQLIPVPTTCPCCQTPLVGDLVRLYCPSDVCPAKNHLRILNWIKVTGIENFGEATVNILEEKGVVTCIKDIYKLPVAGIAMLPGYGEKSAYKIVSNISSTLLMDLHVFLAALGIPSLSTKTAQDLVDNFGSLEAIMAVKVEDLVKIKGYSDISAGQVVDGLAKFRTEIEDLATLIKFKEIVKPEGPLTGKSFCFTGTLAQSRTVYQKMVKDNGGKNDSSVTKSTTYLVCGADVGEAKTDKAKKYGTLIISEQDFLNLLPENCV